MYSTTSVARLRLYSMFVAGATEEFLEVFIRSYTAYRGFGQHPPPCLPSCH